MVSEKVVVFGPTVPTVVQSPQESRRWISKLCSFSLLSIQVGSSSPVETIRTARPDGAAGGVTCAPGTGVRR